LKAWRWLCGLSLGACCLVQGVAAPIELTDAELADVSGQGMIDLSNYSYAGNDFMRMTLNADMQISANLTGIQLGQYTYTVRNGTGSDIPQLSLGISNGTDAQRLVTLSNPYLEFVTAGTGASEQIVGLRLGFGGISGDIGLLANQISGSLLINGGAAGNVDSSADTLGGKRWDGSCSAGATNCLALSSVSAVQAGNSSGPSRDFFISLLKQAVQFAPAATGMSAPATAQSGFWLNWTDRLQALLVNQPVPPNLPKTGN